ncbi:hypothetical protein [Allohahella sp. A8]|uniref:hypothetical protein n=1 Tax=Allohahella sp. A8 TaxID=3141461 RepID=UPI003A804985
MSRIYTYSETFSIGDLARAVDVASEFQAVQSGLERLPKLSTEGIGFAEPFRIADALEAFHPVTKAQLDAAKVSVVEDKAAAELFSEQAESSAISAAASEAATATASAEITALSSGIIDIKNQAQEQANRSQSAADLSRDWALKPFNQTVDGPGTRSALHYSVVANQHADTAAGYANDARQLTSGARKYMGYHSAAGGTMPIAAPTSTDRGKYWYISAAGTLPGVGAVALGDELSINSVNAYEAAGLNSDSIKSINGKTGNAVTLSITDFDGAPRLHTHTDYVNKGLNLSDLPSPSTARTSLGLGTAATKNVGTGAYDVVQRDANGNIPGGSGTASATAQRLASPITLALSGGVAGQATTDFGGNVTIATVVNPANHNHTKINQGEAIGFAGGAASITGLCHARSGVGWPESGSVLHLPGGTNGQGALQLFSPDGASPTLQYRIANNQTGNFGALQTVMSKTVADGLYLAKGDTANKATRLAEARQVKLSGDVTGSSNAFDGSQDASISVALDANKVLQKLVTVDGAGSGLDADKLDGLESTAFRKTADKIALTITQIESFSAGVTAVSVSTFNRNSLLFIRYRPNGVNADNSVTAATKKGVTATLYAGSTSTIDISQSAGGSLQINAFGCKIYAIDELAWS